MKKITFTLVLAFLTVFTLKAQLSFSKVGSFNDRIFISYYTSNGTVFYTMEIVDNTDIKFTVFDNNFSEGHSFTISNCVRDEESIMLAEIIPRDGTGTDESYLTQTLFNSDDKFEVLRIVYNEINTEWGTDFEITGIEIVSEDDIVLGTLPQELHKTYMDAFTLGGNNYLGRWSDNDGDGFENSSIYNVYAINENGSNDISFKEIKSSFAYPNPVSSSKTFTIQLEEKISGTNSYIEINDMNGRILDRQRISEGQEIKVSTHKLRKGQYIYNVISNDKKVDSGKIIIQ